MNPYQFLATDFPPLPPRAQVLHPLHQAQPFAFPTNTTQMASTGYLGPQPYPTQGLPWPPVVPTYPQALPNPGLVQAPLLSSAPAFLPNHTQNPKRSRGRKRKNKQQAQTSLKRPKRNPAPPSSLLPRLAPKASLPSLVEIEVAPPPSQPVVPSLLSIKVAPTQALQTQLQNKPSSLFREPPAGAPASIEALQVQIPSTPPAQQAPPAPPSSSLVREIPSSSPKPTQPLLVLATDPEIVSITPVAEAPPSEALVSVQSEPQYLFRYTKANTSPLLTAIVHEADTSPFRPIIPSPSTPSAGDPSPKTEVLKEIPSPSSSPGTSVEGPSQVSPQLIPSPGSSDPGEEPGPVSPSLAASSAHGTNSPNPPPYSTVTSISLDGDGIPLFPPTFEGDECSYGFTVLPYSGQCSPSNHHKPPAHKLTTHGCIQVVGPANPVSPVHPCTGGFQFGSTQYPSVETAYQLGRSSQLTPNNNSNIMALGFNPFKAKAQGSKGVKALLGDLPSDDPSVRAPYIPVLTAAVFQHAINCNQALKYFESSDGKPFSHTGHHPKHLSLFWGRSPSGAGQDFLGKILNRVYKWLVQLHLISPPSKPLPLGPRLPPHISPAPSGAKPNLQLTTITPPLLTSSPMLAPRAASASPDVSIEEQPSQLTISQALHVLTTPSNSPQPNSQPSANPPAAQLNSQPGTSSPPPQPNSQTSANTVPLTSSGSFLVDYSKVKKHNGRYRPLNPAHMHSPVLIIGDSNTRRLSQYLTLPNTSVHHVPGLNWESLRRSLGALRASPGFQPITTTQHIVLTLGINNRNTAISNTLTQLTASINCLSSMFPQALIHLRLVNTDLRGKFILQGVPFHVVYNQEVTNLVSNPLKLKHTNWARVLLVPAIPQTNFRCAPTAFIHHTPLTSQLLAAQLTTHLLRFLSN